MRGSTRTLLLLLVGAVCLATGGCSLFGRSPRVSVPLEFVQPYMDRNEARPYRLCPGCWIGLTRKNARVLLRNGTRDTVDARLSLDEAMLAVLKQEAGGRTLAFRAYGPDNQELGHESGLIEWNEFSVAVDECQDTEQCLKIIASLAKPDSLNLPSGEIPVVNVIRR